MRRERGVCGLCDLLAGRPVILGEHMLMIVRHHTLHRVPGADLLSAKHKRDVDGLARHRCKPCFQ
jgi:hypothetical protein